MPRLFLGNFDFEHELSAQNAYVAPTALQRIGSELAFTWIAIADAGDAIYTPEPPEAAFARHLESHAFACVEFVTNESVGAWVAANEPVTVVPWGCTPGVARWAREHGVHDHLDCPPQEAVRAVNSRRFSSMLEREFDVGLPGATAVHNIEELRCALAASSHQPDALARAAVAKQPSSLARRAGVECEEYGSLVEYRDWVVKAEFGMSARERVRGVGSALEPNALHWIRRCLDRDGVVFFEPWVDRICEYGLQFEISRHGPPELVGAAELLSDAAGVYRGSRIAAGSAVENECRDVIDVARRTVVRIQEWGYVGPVGIDAMRYRDENGTVKLRPLMDVNARFTMGRLSLGLRRLLEPDEHAIWLHQRPKVGDESQLASWFENLQRTAGSGVRVVRTSPLTVGGKLNRHATAFAIGDLQELQTLQICASGHE